MGSLESIYEVLKQDDRLITQDEKLLKNKIYELGMKMDKKLLKLLYSNELTKNIFFIDVDGIQVFDKIKFGWLIDSKDFLPDSYTEYKNKIMLSDDKRNSIKNFNDVVLSFPYKDCILEGGQTKDSQERMESFYNEKLAKSDIDVLMSPKVMTNGKLISKGEIKEIISIGDKDNLLIKGNNLIALSSLEKRYKNSIKLAYCDVPYNTGSDSFKYNDNFSRSTWLTFIKNRVDRIIPLLEEDGVLLIQCSFHQYAYLKVLLDEIIGNYIMTFNVLVRHPDRILTGDKDYNDVIEYILVYSKSKNYKMPKQMENKDIDEYIYKVKLLSEGKDIDFGGKKGKYYLPNEYELIKGNPEKENLKIITVRGSIKEKNSSGRFYVKSLKPLEGKYPAKTLFKIEGIGDDIYDYRYFYLPPKGNKNGAYLQGMPTSSKITTKPYANFIDFVQSYNMVNEEGEVEFRNGKKPEELMAFLLNVFTKRKDICLDAFSGSGTTLATALKMDRQFIGVEQMDYIEGITLQRLKNAINGETNGISNITNWTGGGSFIYCELASNSKAYIDKVQKADCNGLLSLYKELYNSDFVSYRVDINELEKQQYGFSSLSEDEQRTFLISVIDKNTLYINLSDIDNQDFIISENDKKFTKSFYGMKE